MANLGLESGTVRVVPYDSEWPALYAAEIARIEVLGVRIELETHVTDALDAMRDGGFDAVFVAVGEQIGKRA